MIIPCTVDATGRIAVVRPVGEMDIATAEALRDALARACASEADTVVVDLAAVTFIDCSAIGVLVVTAKTLRSAGCKLLIGNAASQPMRTLQLTGVPSVVVVAPPGAQLDPEVAALLSA